jgi:hypothetical protein
VPDGRGAPVGRHVVERAVDRLAAPHRSRPIDRAQAPACAVDFFLYNAVLKAEEARSVLTRRTAATLAHTPGANARTSSRPSGIDAVARRRRHAHESSLPSESRASMALSMTLL